MGNERRDTEPREGMHIDPFARSDKASQDGLERGSSTAPEMTTEPTDGTTSGADPALAASGEGFGPGEGRESRGTAALVDRGEKREKQANPERSSDSDKPLVEGNRAQEFRSRWEKYQQRFVDEPKGAVQSADELVAEVMQTVASQFASTRESLESQWDRGDEVSTEDLRLAMQHYRDFFNRLLAA